MYDDISYTVEGGIATVMIDRPGVLNAFRERTISELNDALDRFRDEEEVYAGVLTGAEGGFCAGADVTSMPNWSDESKAEYGAFLREVQSIVRTLRESEKPIVAAVGGPAIGAGCDFALACDVRFVSPDAVLREGFVNVGLVPGDGGAWLLPRLIGESKAREYLLTGRDITPSDAVDLGLAVDIADDVMERSRAFASEMRDLPATAVRRTNRLIDLEEGFDEHCTRAINYQWECVNDAEHMEAVEAFNEGREPAYNRGK
jgi:enoyl-CoA hydratase/carnithine racemase